MTGRIVGGIAGDVANFGMFEGMKEAESQFVHGGKPHLQMKIVIFCVKYAM